MLEWLVIGGGIHGTYLSHVIVNLGGVSADDVRVLDPHARPLALWNRYTRNCGMRYLRSPATHHIDLGILSIYKFAKTTDGLPYADFIPPYNRPSLDLFHQHSQYVIARHGLAQMRLQGRAHAVVDQGAHIGVESDAGSLTARRVLLALGLSEQPYWPRWAHRLHAEGAPIFHLFDQGFDRRALPHADRVAIIGAGSSAVQLALKLVSDKPCNITLCAHGPPRESQYDFDPCWIGPKCLRGFDQKDFRQRRRLIDGARHPGTIPGETMHALQAALEKGRLRWQNTGHDHGTFTDGEIQLQMDAGTKVFDQVILATGFSAARPGGALVDQMIDAFGLPCGRCGYPQVGRDLRWHPHIYITGPLAELQLGPCARNIVGARNAGRLLTQHLAS
jgi:hypothetical protein